MVDRVGGDLVAGVQRRKFFRLDVPARVADQLGHPFRFEAEPARVDVECSLDAVFVQQLDESAILRRSVVVTQDQRLAAAAGKTELALGVNGAVLRGAGRGIEHERDG